MHTVTVFLVAALAGSISALPDPRSQHSKRAYTCSITGYDDSENDVLDQGQQTTKSKAGLYYSINGKESGDKGCLFPAVSFHSNSEVLGDCTCKYKGFEISGTPQGEANMGAITNWAKNQRTCEFDCDK
ncbi:hypothetical protein SUNI508_12643 [Seiridium unicorne]|uniref:Uncharacterized protein n=1 Tax=Seiridium unicorne TaxID=138068 RepID=A0ABR2VGY2_9PEZI